MEIPLVFLSSALWGLGSALWVILPFSWKVACVCTWVLLACSLPIKYWESYNFLSFCILFPFQSILLVSVEIIFSGTSWAFHGFHLDLLHSNKVTHTDLFEISPSLPAQSVGEYLPKRLQAIGLVERLYEAQSSLLERALWVTEYSNFLVFLRFK